MTTLRIEDHQLIEQKDNPNKMSAESFDVLVRAMAHVGFLQPLLVRPAPDDVTSAIPQPGKYIIVDGVHRLKASRVVLGMKDSDVPHRFVDRLHRVQSDLKLGLPCLVGEHLTESDAELARVGMNRMRGELDLAMVSNGLMDLKVAGLSNAELTISGFSRSEIDDLLASVKVPTEAELLAGAPAIEDVMGEKGDKVEKPFLLELTFATRGELARAKKALRKAAGGKGGDMAQGLLRLAEGA